jgi:hypothetical protein
VTKSIERVVAVDWSGDKGPGQKKKIWAGVWTCPEVKPGKIDGGSVLLEAGRTRAELIAWLIELARETPQMVVGIDCCFSYPAWFLAEHACTSVFDLWQHVAAGHGERWLGTTCTEAERDPRFWGRPHKRPAEFSGPHLHRMMRRTDMENKIEQTLPGGDPQRAALMHGVTPKSPFQIGGSGAVGTGSLRAMPWLLHLREHGFAVWPFEDAALNSPRPQPLLVEMYTRLLTGPVKKSNPDARHAYLKQRRAGPEKDPLYAGLTRAVVTKAESSEDAFDALVCCVEMTRWRNQFAGLNRTLDPTLQLEGITWRPGVMEAATPAPQAPLEKD